MLRAGRTVQLCAALLAFAIAMPAAWAQDVVLVDSFIRDVFSARDTSRYEAAAEAYLGIVGGTQEADEDLRLTHLRYAVQVMPPADRPPDAGLLAAGPRIALWWRRQDPFPATRANERLEEHLARYVEASTYLAGDNGEIDDRGRIYIRLGPPSSRHSIKLPASVRAFDLPTQPHVPRLAENEFWVYDHLGDEAHFFFVREDGEYRLTIPYRLIPSQLRSGVASRSRRGEVKSEMLLLLAEEIYAQLALAHPFYGATLDEIAHFRGRPPSGREPPAETVRSILASASARESDAAARQSEEVPVSFSNTRGLTEYLPVAARRARFLEADSTTRTEIYWVISPSDLAPSTKLVRALEDAGYEASDDYVLVVSAARADAEYAVRDIQRAFYRVRPSGAAPHPREFALRGDAALFHAGLQWDLYWSAHDHEGMRPYGPVLKTGAVRFDSLVTLDARQFEMSDLRLESSGLPVAAQRIERMPSELYFEVYNLNYGPDDLTRYTVAYVIRRADDRASVLTRSAATQSGSQRTAHERIALRLAAPPGVDRMQIEVRVTDEVTGEERVRTAEFEL